MPPSFPSLTAWTFFHRLEPNPSLGISASLPFPKCGRAVVGKWQIPQTNVRTSA